MCRRNAGNHCSPTSCTGEDLTDSWIRPRLSIAALDTFMSSLADSMTIRSQRDRPPPWQPYGPPCPPVNGCVDPGVHIRRRVQGFIGLGPAACSDRWSSTADRRHRGTSSATATASSARRSRARRYCRDARALRAGLRVRTDEYPRPPVPARAAAWRPGQQGAEPLLMVYPTGVSK